MERFQGPLSSSFLDEYLEQGLVGTESLLKLEELQASSLEGYNINVQSLVESYITLTHESESNEGRKRKRKNVEQQRMTHIAVERNRRRQMNHHLTVLKSLMPPSYLQKGDQASIIGGAINFVKELKQLLHSLEAQKRPRKIEEVVGSSGLFEHGNYEEVNYGDEIKAEKKSEAIVVEVTQTHAKLKVQCLRRHGQLTKVIVALEELRLTILHLNITSSEATVLFYFNLKIEEDSKLVSASEIAEAVDHIFGSINDTLGSW